MIIGGVRLGQERSGRGEQGPEEDGTQEIEERGKCLQTWGLEAGVAEREAGRSREPVKGGSSMEVLPGRALPQVRSSISQAFPKSHTFAQAGHTASSSDAETVEENSLPEGAGLGMGPHIVCPLEGPRCSLGKQEAFISSLWWGEVEAFTDKVPSSVFCTHGIF